MAATDSFAFAAAYWLATRELLLLASIGILISSLDDLLIDAIYGLRRLWRALTVYRRTRRSNAENLTRNQPGAPLAVFIPAWKEAAVIGPMLRSFLARADYDNYRIFVGVYPNDPDTRAVAAAIDDPRISIVETCTPGPTTKADCLNHIWDAMGAVEAQDAMRFKAVVLHDAEDVIHPLELRLFDFMIPAKAMVQLPVVPIPDRSSRWIAGHYLDEFAESHAKDMVVREAIGAAMPSAGVACAFDRGVLGKIARELGGAPFDADSLTEDYELGHRIAARGGDAAMVRIAGRKTGGQVVTREHFPATLEAALRQKSRWMLGIALQGWDRVGWQGGLAARYMLLRDRKALLSALVIVIAYAAATAFAGTIVIRASLPAAATLPAVVEPDSALAMLLTATSLILVWRLMLRAMFTAHQHGLAEGLRAVPRALVANIINFLAALRAIRHYLRLLVSRQCPEWDKTEHRFPQSLPAE